MNSTVLELRGIVQKFDQGETHLEVLRGIDFELRSGEIVALVGPSGSGKSTLLQIAGLLEQASIGEILINGVSTKDLDDDRLTGIRRKEIGFVYQYHHLLTEFSAKENIVIPQIISRVDKKTSNKRADFLLEILSLSNRASHRPAKLSGGEQQRVAIARAMANKPTVLLADEPTGNLDSITADSVFQLMADLVHDSGVGALIATHNSDLASRMDRIVRLEGGLLVGA
ncbi:MAG: ABC transporter ATP-binding protein [Pseudomonadota bacterium]|nr:ABC transporter ATP-binding protein [Pseudomonadota bacterium]